MSTTVVPSSRTSAVSSPGRTALRWLVSFAGFPLGGLAAMLLIGPIDGVLPALAGGFVTGLVLGAGQAWALRFRGRLGAVWALVTALGLAAGLAVGASAVRFSTDLADLALQGAICGALVGAGQAVVLWRRLRHGGGTVRPIGVVAVWPGYLAAAWAIGWTITTTIGVDVDRQFTVFGSAGAVTVTALTVVLPLVLRSRIVRTGEAS